MKKIALISLAVIMIAVFLSACSGKKGSVEDVTDMSAPVSEEAATLPEALTLPAATTAKESTTAKETTTEKATTAAPTTAKPTTTKAPATTAKPSTTKAPATEKPTDPPTKAPTTAAPTTQKTVNASDLAEGIAAHSEWFAEPMYESSGSRGLKLYGIDESLVSETSYYAASAAVAEEILVIKTKGSGAVSEIRNAMNARLAEQAEDYADYVPAEVPKLNNAVVYSSGDVIVCCVSGNSSAVKSYVASQF